VSADGSRVLFRSSFSAPLYQHGAGAGTTLITRSHRAGDAPGTSSVVSTLRASDDGRTVTFAANGALTDDSEVGAGGALPGALYRWSADGDRLEDLTARFTPDGTPLALNLVGVSKDGRYVWFGSNRPLTADAGTQSLDRLYVLDTSTDTLRLVTAFPGQSGTAGTYRFSPSGNRVAFQAYDAIAGAISPDPACREAAIGPGLCGNVFTYDVATPDVPVRCVSCGPAGTVLRAAAASFGRPATAFDGRDNRAVLDDGRVYFDTPNRLDPDDTNDVGDVYEWSPGRGASLISSGTSGEPASFGDVSQSGRDVFLVTADRLVPQDADALADLYAEDAVHEFPFFTPNRPDKLVGREAVRASYRESWASHPLDIDAIVDAFVEDGADPEVVIGQWRLSASVRETGKAVGLTGLLALRVSAGKITHVRDFMDTLGVAHALGRLPFTPAPST
jgi:ketosteroid isomerase-like protein